MKPTLTRIVVRVSLVADQSDRSSCRILASQAVDIPISGEAPIRLRDVIDACQRSVAHCIDEMEETIHPRKKK